MMTGSRTEIEDVEKNVAPSELKKARYDEDWTHQKLIRLQLEPTSALAAHSQTPAILTKEKDCEKRKE